MVVSSPRLLGRVILSLLCVTLILVPLGIAGAIALRTAARDAQFHITESEFSNLARSLELLLPNVAVTSLAVLKLLATSISVYPVLTYADFVAMTGSVGSELQVSVLIFAVCFPARSLVSSMLVRVSGSSPQTGAHSFLGSFVWSRPPWLAFMIRKCV